MAFLTSLSSRIRNAVGAGGGRGLQGPLVPPVSGRSVNPIPIGKRGGADYAQHITTASPSQIFGPSAASFTYAKSSKKLPFC